MKILSLITKNNTVIVDSNIVINSDAINSYKIHFDFQSPWDSDLKLYAVFKPVNDASISLELDNNFECFIPPQIYRKCSKLGVGIKGVYRASEGYIETRLVSNLYYIPVRLSGVSTENSYVKSLLDKIKNLESTIDDYISGDLTEITTHAENIRPYSFYNYNSLNVVNLYDTKIIHDNSFTYSGLTELNLFSDNIVELESSNALANTPIAEGKGFINVPKKLLDSYKNDLSWSQYESQFIGL